MSVISTLQRKRTLGILFPIRYSSSDGVFETTSTSLQKIKANIYLLLMTGYGERVMMPSFGSPITQFLFENIGETTTKQLTNEIKTSLEKWVPQIFIDNILITNEESTPNRLDIQIKFRLKADTSIEDELVIQLKST